MENNVSKFDEEFIKNHDKDSNKGHVLNPIWTGGG